MEVEAEERDVVGVVFGMAGKMRGQEVPCFTHVAENDSTVVVVCVDGEIVVVEMNLEVLAQRDGVGVNEEGHTVHTQGMEAVIAASRRDLWRVAVVRDLEGWALAGHESHGMNALSSHRWGTIHVNIMSTASPVTLQRCASRARMRRSNSGGNGYCGNGERA